MKRLLWNFEIDPRHALNFSQLASYDIEDLRWEARFFWPQESIIVLHGLTEDLLKLANFKSKHRQDTYHLLHNYDYNIKLRRNELLYKPLITLQQNLGGFAKKINLLDASSEALLPGIPPILTPHLLELTQQQSTLITVNKDAHIYKFATLPAVKLELSRLEIGAQNYFSACVEGRSFPLVQHLSQQIFGDRTPCDYVHFLKTRNTHD